MSKVSKYFKSKELFPPEIIKQYGESKVWGLLDQRLVDMIDLMKELFGYTILINYGDQHYRGFRPIGCGVGSVSGAHYKGMAVDITFLDKTGKQVPVKDIQKLIIKNKVKLTMVCGLELNVTWNHCDVMAATDSPYRNGIGNGKILCFDVTDNNKSWVATKPEDSDRIK
jgi:hypothetical protein